MILIRSLPKEYVATIDTLDAMKDLPVEEKLKQLQTKESRLISSQRNENAFPSFKNDKNRFLRDLQTTSEQSEDSGYSPPCYLCGRRHFIKACPFMEVAQDAVHEYIRTTKSICITPKQRDSCRSLLFQARSPSNIRYPKNVEKKVGFKGKDRAYEACTNSDSEVEEDSDIDSDVLTHKHAQISRALINR